MKIRKAFLVRIHARSKPDINYGEYMNFLLVYFLFYKNFKFKFISD